MNIKTEDVFIYVLNISGAIVSQNSEITPQQAVKRAVETLCHARMCSDAWEKPMMRTEKSKIRLKFYKVLAMN
jgi:hypothetical protein